MPEDLKHQASSTHTPLTTDDVAWWLRLMCTEDVGPVTAQKLLAAFGLPQQIFAQSRSALMRIVSERVANHLLQPPTDELKQQIQHTLRWLEQDNNYLLSLACSQYPQHLLRIADPPILLYAKGNLALLQQTHGIAMVGSRNATQQGLETTQQFAYALAMAGYPIVSGLALGIDAAAHRGALAAVNESANAASTIAVIGTGCDIIYPANNQTLTYQVAEHGLILSEFHLGTPALTQNFPRRNRIISGLSQGVLVVEAALKSGSLITARQALEQNRDVFAIPGSIHSPLSRGCHALIKQGAKLVESAQDIIDELGQIHTPAQLPPAQSKPRPATSTPKTSIAAVVVAPTSLSPQEQLILAQLGFDPCALETLIERTGLAVDTLITELMHLELAGLVEKRTGQVYVRLSAPSAR